jgi:branched-chain amino acid transport system substrate-binding protein
MPISLVRAATACAALLALSVALPAAPLRAADAPYDINVILSTTGPAAVAGVPLSTGMKVLEEMVNAGGGIKGRPIRFVVNDDQSLPQVAVQLVNGMIAQKAPVIVGPMTTASCGAVDALIEKGGPVSYCVSPYIAPAAGSFQFSGGPDPADAAAAAIRFFRLRGMTRFAMLNATDASGIALDKAFDQAFQLPENKSLTVVAHQHFSPADTSAAAQISQIKAANPQVLITWMVGAPFATVVRGTHDGGLDIPVMTNAANMSVRYMMQLAALLPKEVDFAAYPSYPQVPVNAAVASVQAAEMRAFEADHLKAEGTGTGAWDIGLLVVDALRHLPANPTGEQVRAYISGVSGWAASGGVYDFRKFPQRGVGQNGSIVARWDAASGTFLAASKPGGEPAK